MSIALPEPMLRYACNQQGCCCQGWRIPFKPPDLVRLGRYLPASALESADERRETSPEGVSVVRDLSLLDADGRCRFLDGDHKRCTVHAQHGIDALPDVCVSFPVASYALGDGIDFLFDPVCPSVLDQIAESDEPVEMAVQSGVDAAFERRASRLHATPLLRVGAIEISHRCLRQIRETIVGSLREARPAIEHQQAIDGAYGELASGGDFTLRYDGDGRRYRKFFQRCIAQHGAGTLEGVFQQYRRFLYAIPHDPRSAAWDELETHLRRWEAAHDRWYAPNELAIQPLLRRYLAHRHFAPFAVIGGELSFAPALVVHALATAFRFASAFGAVFRRPVDRSIMKAAIGASEYVYRSLEIAPASLPWFGISD